MSIGHALPPLNFAPGCMTCAFVPLTSPFACVVLVLFLPRPVPSLPLWLPSLPLSVPCVGKSALALTVLCAVGRLALSLPLALPPMIPCGLLTLPALASRALPSVYSAVASISLPIVPFVMMIGSR